MTKDGLKADGAIKKDVAYKGVVYDLDLNDAMDGIYPESKLNMPDVIDDMNARWRNVSLNWKFINASDGLSWFSSASGVVMPTLIPTVPGITQVLQGASAMDIAVGLCIGAHMAALSPCPAAAA